MKRKNFSLVWGRKLFFGVGWPILMLIALSFVLKTGLPESVISIILLVTQLIAQTGMLVLLGYFFLFYPVVFIIPTYYLSRIWGIAILNVLIAAYLVDAIVYLNYGLHLNSFITQYIVLQAQVLEWKAYLALIPLIFTTIFMWSRGNSIWNEMQRKFMNTNGRWYIWVILFSFITTQAISVYHQLNYSKHIGQVLEQFPIRIPLPQLQFNNSVKGYMPQDRDVKIPKIKNFYPKALSCTPDKNFIFVVYQDFPESAHHYKEHGLNLPGHYAAKSSVQDSLNSLLYSFPESASKKLPESQMIRTLKDYEYHLEFFTSNADLRIDGISQPKMVGDSKNWMKAYIESSSTKNFAAFFYVEDGEAFKKTIDDLIIELSSKKLINDTIIVFTAVNGEAQGTDVVKVPTVLLWSDHEMSEIKKMTTQYDVMPTMIEEGLNCKMDNKEFVFGHNFLKTKSNQYLVYTKEHEAKIWLMKEDVNFSLRDLDYFSPDLNVPEILKIRESFYNFLK